LARGYHQVITHQSENPPTGGSADNELLEQEVVRLHNLHSEELLSYAVSITRDKDLALDAVQEAYLRYFIERRYGRCVENPRAWLYRVLRNYLLDRRDSAAGKHEVSDAHVDQVADRDRGPEEIIHQAQLAREITESLSAREMDCLRLRAEGFSYAETAEVLDIRPGTVAALLARAHTKLRKAAGDGCGRRLGVAEALYYLFEGRNGLFIPASRV
jgi:RNA polymerase sigma-70 factor, ECF subfamily